MVDIFVIFILKLEIYCQDRFQKLSQFLKSDLTVNTN